MIFDFDGTLSWLRSGWPDIMAELFAGFLPSELAKSQQMRKRLRREILALNGKPSIHQMERFHELASELGVAAPAPEGLLEQYLSRLDATLQGRIAALAHNRVPPSAYVISGAFRLLEELRDRGINMAILSGTAEADVRREAELLGLQAFFGQHIYGSTPGKDFCKKHVIDRIIRDERIEGAHLLSFGDGPVEIQFTKAVGGMAVGVASDEHNNGSGLIDSDKREHLIRAGADAIIADYRNTPWILETFFRETR